MEEKFVILTENDEILRRKKKVEKLEKDIIDITEMFKDLNKLVYEKQNKIDFIECNISMVKEKTKEAEKELVKAEKYQKKSRLLEARTVSILATGLGIPLGMIFGAKVAICIICGTSITYIITR